eukprot:TRINITY_DN3204_c0_g1_i1.p1 TRINITY_DN3204_c0_g1~~TRINITY_DN3204_c0_g1_i1.p1  ORF type:complete len:454 (+),score=62.43 TRINITY_DN3204_c0_g1_i1:1183-2544(+)
MAVINPTFDIIIIIINNPVLYNCKAQFITLKMIQSLGTWQIYRSKSGRVCKPYAENVTDNSKTYNKFESTLKLIGALQKQVQKETLPWVQDLIQPLVQGDPQPLQGLVDVENLADDDSKFEMVNGIRIHYKERGPICPQSPTLVLLHGFNGNTFQWRYIMDDLSSIQVGQEGCRVIAIDRPPFGLTERPTTWPQHLPNPYSNSGAAAQTIGLLNVLGINDCIAVGHSAGANVAVQMAINYPARVRELILISPGISVKQGRFGRDLGQQLRILYTLNLMKQDGPAINYIRNTTFKRMKEIQQGKASELYASSGPGSTASKEYLEGYLRPARFEGWDRGLVEQIRSFDPQSVIDLSKLKGVEALVVNGEKDKTTSVQFVKQFFDEFVNNGGVATYSEIKNCGHVPMEEKPKELVQILNNYLQKKYNTALNEKLDEKIVNADDKIDETFSPFRQLS